MHEVDKTNLFFLYLPMAEVGNLGLVWLPSFGARIKEFICDSRNYLFGCHGIGYGIHFEFHDFHPMPNLNTYVVPCHFCGFVNEMISSCHFISFLPNEMK
jgi:hypothetical protein